MPIRLARGAWSPKAPVTLLMGLTVAYLDRAGVRERAEIEANARLIASAPELLAAARLAVAWSEQVPAPYRDWPHVAAARAAIAKATGGAA